ncbi:MAG: efflux RND transporter periplasmic adaptor subunit [Acidobacteriota bacterium]
MKKALIAVPIVVVLAAIVLLSMRPRQDAGTKIYAAKAKKETLVATVKASGEIAPAVKVNVSANVSGRIEELYVREGDAVLPGAKLVNIDAAPYRTEVGRLEAMLRMAEIGVKEQDMALREAKSIAARRKSLHEKGLIAPEDYDRALIAAESAEVRLAQQKEQVEQARSALDKARDELGKTDLSSPIAGMVTELKAERGENVVTGLMNNPGTVIMVIADMSSVIGEFSVDENDVPAIVPGQSVKVAVEALPNDPLSGKVTEIRPSAVKQLQSQDVPTFTVKVKLDTAHPKLRPGMSARATIETEQRPDAVTVPIQAILTNEGEKDDDSGDGAEKAEKKDAAAEPGKKAEWVFVVEGGKAKKRDVKTGLSNERAVEVVSGLAADEQVVTGPYRSLKDLKDGDAVKVEKEQKAKDKDKDKGAVKVQVD